MVRKVEKNVTKKELIKDVLLIGFSVKPYKLWFIKKKRLERIVKNWEVLITYKKEQMKIKEKENEKENAKSL